EILKRVRAAAGVSRVDLARHLDLAPSTAGIYVERLIKEGYLEESDKAERETGRPPMLLRLNAERGEFVGVDFEARNIMAVAVDFSDKPLRNAHLRIAESDSAMRRCAFRRGLSEKSTATAMMLRASKSTPTNSPRSALSRSSIGGRPV